MPALRCGETGLKISLDIEVSSVCGITVQCGSGKIDQLLAETEAFRSQTSDTLDQAMRKKALGL